MLGIRLWNFYKTQTNNAPKNKTYEKTIKINKYCQCHDGPGANGSVSDHRHQRCRPERGLACAVGFQDYNRHDAETTTSGQRVGSRQGLGREVQREIVLRVSDWNEGQDLRRKTKAIQRLQTGACGAAGESASTPSRSAGSTADQPGADDDIRGRGAPPRRS